MNSSETFLTLLRSKLEGVSDLPFPVKNWIEHADDEIAVVTQMLARRLTKTQSSTTEHTLSEYTAILGYGRTFKELIEDLQRFGIITRTTEETAPGSYAEHDAIRNPSWDLGRMFYWMRKIMEENQLLNEDAVLGYIIGGIGSN